MPYYWNKFILHPDPPDFPYGGNGSPIDLPENTGYISPFDTEWLNTPSLQPSTFPSLFPVADENNNTLTVNLQPVTIQGAFQKPPDYLLEVRLLDGSDILKDYKNTQVKSNELCVWYEEVKAKKSNLFGDFCLVKFDKLGTMASLLNRLETTGTSLTGNTKGIRYVANDIGAFLAYVDKSFREIHSSNIDQNKLYQAIDVARNLNKGQDKIKVGYVTLEGVVIDLARTGLENIKFLEHNYQPNGDEQGNKYDPLLPIGAIKKAIQELTEESEKSQEEDGFNISSILNTAATIFDKVAVALSDNQNPLKKFSGLFRNVSEKLTQIKTALKEAGETTITTLELLNAFLCGVLNGLFSLLDMVLALFGFIYGSLKDVKTVDAAEYYYGSREKMEVIESLIDEVSNKWDALWAAVSKCCEDFNEESLKEIAAALGIGDYNKYDWAFIAGSFVFEVLAGVALFLLTGGAGTIAQASTRTAKLVQLMRTIAIEAFSTATAGVFDLLAFLRNVLVGFIKAANKGAKGIAAYIKQLRKGDAVFNDSEGGIITAPRKLTKAEEKINELIAKTRFQFKKLNIQYQWKFLIRTKQLSHSDMRRLAAMRNVSNAIKKANVAEMKVIVKLRDGTTKEFSYLAHSGNGNKIPGSVSVPTPKPKNYKSDFKDYGTNQVRWSDSENKMLVAMDKDLGQLDLNGAQISIDLKSTFEPCTICKREIIVRKKIYNAQVRVWHSKATTGEEFAELLNNT